MSTDNLLDLLSNLYKEELNRNFDEYLFSHSGKNAIQRRIDVFKQYKIFLPRNGRVLDWGCWHALDSCMIKSYSEKDISMHGCGFLEPGSFPTFWNFASLQYQKLDHIFELPYEDNFFDVVIGSGVLEHVAMDYESLKEIYRVLKNNGFLIITFLPNRFSYTEFFARITKRHTHIRRYGMKETKGFLLHFGFEPIYFCYHQFIPSQKCQVFFEKLWPLNGFFERIWPINKLCANIMVIGRKRIQMR